MNSGLPPRALIRVGVQFPMIRNISLSVSCDSRDSFHARVGFAGERTTTRLPPSPSTWRSALTTLPGSSPMACVWYSIETAWRYRALQGSLRESLSWMLNLIDTEKSGGGNARCSSVKGCACTSLTGS